MKKTIKVNLLMDSKSRSYKTIQPIGQLDNHPDYIVIGTGFAEIEMFDYLPTAIAEVDKLREHKEKTLAEQCLAIKDIDDKIQSLLAAGHD